MLMGSNELVFDEILCSLRLFIFIYSFISLQSIIQ